MNEILFVDALEALHDLNDYFGGMFQREGLAGQFGLVGQQVSMFAVLHNDYDEVAGCLSKKLLVYSY